MDDRAQEKHVRTKAKQQGFRLVKSRGKVPEALDFGRFLILENETGLIATQGDDWLSLDEIEAWLNE